MEAAKLNIRPATAADAPALAAIFNAYLGKATMVLDPRSAEDCAEIIGGAKTTVLVGTDPSDQVVGFAYVRPYSDRRGYSLAGEVTIFLEQRTTSSGLGTAFYELLLPAADALGYRHLTAKIWADNAGSIRFHERFGFRLVGTQYGIGFVNGKRIDTVLMEKVW